MSVWKMAWRNVWRSKRRSLVTIGAMTFALVVEILYTGLIPGFMESMQSDIVDLELGEMQVFAEDYLERPSLYTTLEDPDALVAELDEMGYPASARLIGGGLAASGEFSAGVQFRGVDVERDKHVTLIQEKLHAGQWLDAADPQGVVIGRQLSKTLNAEPGAELIVLSQGADGSMANDLFIVRGVLSSVAAGTDRTVVFMHDTTFRELMVLPGGAHQLIVRTPQDVELDVGKEAVVAAAAAVDPRINVMTWKELNPIVAQMLDSTKGMIMVLLFIVYIAVGILILNAMLMSVFERIREFGVLKAIGMGPFKVFSLIMVESLMQTCVALVAGLAVAAPCMWYMANKGIPAGALSGTDMMGIAMRPVWYGIYYPEDIIQGPVFLLFFVVFFSVLYPSLKAALINPIEAITYGASRSKSLVEWLLTTPLRPLVVLSLLPWKLAGAVFDKLVPPALRQRVLLAVNGVLRAVLPGFSFLAWRNLWRQKRRTILTLASIAFGGFLAVLMTAMQERSFADFIDTAARLGSGHVTMQHVEYQDTPTLTRTVTGTDEKRALAVGDQDVALAVDRTSGQTMLSTASDNFGAIFVAYDPEAESSESFALAEGLEEGEMFATSADRGIVLGKTLARNLDAEIGDKVVYTLTDRNGEIVSGMGRLRGIVVTGAPSLDAGLCLLPLDTVRATLGYDPTESTRVAVFLDDSRRSGKVRDRLVKGLGAGTAVLTWEQVQPELRSFVAMKIGGGRVMIGIIWILVIAGIFNTLFMTVMERVREFGIMMAIGYTPGQLFRMVVWESLWLGTVGLALSVLITAYPYWYLHGIGIDLSAAYADAGTVEVAGVGFDMVLRIGMYTETGIVIAVLILLATLAAGIYPAWKAGRVEPVDSIKLV
jgi:ABC-type lipoprotein release transport system permease subunit